MHGENINVRKNKTGTCLQDVSLKQKNNKSPN